MAPRPLGGPTHGLLASWRQLEVKSRIVGSVASCLFRVGTVVLTAALVFTFAFPFGFAAAQEPAARGISLNETEDSLMARGLEHLAAGRFGEAAALLAQAVAMYPESGRLRAAFGLAYSLRGGVDRAISRSMVAVLDGQGTALSSDQREKALTGVARADLEAGQAQFLLALEAKEPDIRGAAMYALVSAALGDTESARTVLGRMGASATGEPLYYAAEGYLAFITGDLTRALDAFRTGTALCHTGNFFDDLAAFYLQGGLGSSLLASSAEPGSKMQVDEALRHIAEARTSPLGLDHGFVWFAEGLAYEATGETEKALTALKTAVQFDAGLSAAYEHLGFAARWLGDTGAAKEAYARALEEDPSSIRARLGAAAAASEAGDHKAAFKAYEQALSQAPPEDRDIVLTLMAQERLAMGGPREAMALIGEAAVLNPRSRVVSETRERIAKEAKDAGTPAGSGVEYSLVYNPVPYAKSPAVYINGDSPWVVSDEVVLDVYGKFAEVSFSNDYRTWSEWQPLTGEYGRYAWTLASDVRAKRVFVKFRDASGKVFDGYPDSAEQDLTPPAGEYVVNGGNRVTNKSQVLAVAKVRDSEGIRGFWIASGSGAFRWFDRYFTGYPVVLSGADGSKGITVLARSRSGLEGAFEGFVSLDTAGPLAYSVTATDITPSSAELSWLLNEPGTAGVKVYRAGDRSREVASVASERGHGVEHCALIAGLSPSTTYVYTIWAEDAVQNRTVSGEFSFTTRPPDTTPPKGTVRLNGGAQYTNSRDVFLEINAWDDSPGEIMMSIRDALTDWSPWEPVSFARVWTLPAGEGGQSVWVRFRDRAGNVSDPIWASILVDTVAPGIFGFSISDMGYDRAVVRWQTSEPVSGSVELSAGYGLREIASPSTGTVHEVVLTGLSEGTRYSVRVRVTDPAGNTSVSPELTFQTPVRDRNAPTGSIRIRSTGGYVNHPDLWLDLTAKDDRPGQIYMAFSEDGRRWTPWEPFAATRLWRLEGLDGPRKVYVKFADESGNESREYIASVVLDTRPPEVAMVGVDEVGQGYAVISFGTSEFASSRVVYYAQGGRTQSQEAGSDTLFHEVRIRGLTPDTRYSFYIECVDRAQNASRSKTYTFKTAPAQDLAPPRISDVKVGSITETSAVVRWKTDEPATSAVVYGPGANQYLWYVGYLPQGTPKQGSVPGYLSGLTPGGASGEGSGGLGTKTVIVPNPQGGYVTDHSITLTGLEPGTEYHFRVLSIDENGNVGISDDYSFKTIKISPIPPPGPVKPPVDPPDKPPVTPEPPAKPPVTQVPPPPPQDQPPAASEINVALAANGATAQASSQSSQGPSGSGSAGAAIDGNTQTAWRFEIEKGAFKNVKPQTLEVKFKSTCLVSRVQIIGRAKYFPKDIIIEYLREGQWIRLYSGKTGVSGQGEGLAKFSKDFKDFKAEAIRVSIIILPAVEPIYEIAEFEAYGTIIGCNK